MFHTILSGPKPWYFGHIYLPGGSENLENPAYKLLDRNYPNQDNNKATYTGVLMQITDSRQLEDGRLVLVVQALERFEVIQATQHTPYAVATIKLIPDAELAKPFYKDAQTMAQELSDDFLNEKDAWGAACAAALQSAEQYRSFEYRPVFVGSSSMGAVSPLVNFDADVDRGSLVAREMDQINMVMEKQLLSASPMSVPDKVEDLEEPKVIRLEHNVWVQVDQLIKLLHQLNPNSDSNARVAPVPTQMLGLLPREKCPHFIPWPENFQLHQYANRLEDYAATESATVGTFSKSPFVRYDHVDSDLTQYPLLRRAQRLSFAVWILVENIGFVEGSGPLSRQDILEFPSITERLEAAMERLVAVNAMLKNIAG
jgi:ATP-dependent protease La (LON) substrate-binding domain